MGLMDGLVDGAPRLDRAVNSVAISDPEPVEYGDRKLEVCFRVLSDDDCAFLERRSAIFVSAKYMEESGNTKTPGEVSAWIDTAQGMEQVFQEFERQLILNAAVYRVEGGGYALAFEEQTLRAVLTSDQQKHIAGLAENHRSNYNPDTWGPELCVQMMEDAKKNSPELTGYGSVNLSSFIRTVVALLPNWLTTRLSASISSGLPLEMSPRIQSISGLLEEATEEQLSAVEKVLDSTLRPEEQAADLVDLIVNSPELLEALSQAVTKRPDDVVVPDGNPQE